MVYTFLAYSPTFPLPPYHVQICTVPLQSFQSKFWVWFKFPSYVLCVWRRENITSTNLQWQECQEYLDVYLCNSRHLSSDKIIPRSH